MISFTRRDVLVGLLGLPMAAGCKKKPVDPQFAGGFAWPEMPKFGHRLRKALSLEADVTKEVPILILGAGVSGLTSAWQLARAGRKDVTILELADDAGGTAVSGTWSGREFPWGAHYLPAPGADNPDLVELLESLGVCEGRDDQGRPRYRETDLCAAPKERVFYRGLWYQGLSPSAGTSQADREQLERFEKLVAAWVDRKGKDGRRAFTLPLQSCSTDPEILALDELSMSEWLKRHGLNSPRLEWLVDYACRDDFGATAAQTSAWMGLHYFAARTETGADESSEFLTWPSGNGFLVDAMLKTIGSDRIRHGELIAAIRPHGDGRRARVLSISTKTGKVTEWVSAKVICALPSFLRPRLVSGFEGVAEYGAAYAPWLVANLHLKAAPGSNGFPEAWDNVIYDSKSLGYVVATHQTLRSRGPTTWTWYLPMTDDDPKKDRESLLALDWKSAADVVTHELSSCHIDLLPKIERIDFMKWGHGLVRPGVGTVWSDTRRAAAKSSGPLHFAHTDLSGVSLFEEAFFHGTRAAREVMKELPT